MREETDVRIQRIAELLPEYYRENQGELGAPLSIAEEILASAGAHLRRARGRLSEELLLSLKDRWLPSGRAAPGDRPGRSEWSGGTRRGLLEWFRTRTGRVPIVWAGFVVRPIGVDHFQLRRSLRPSAVLVWRREGLSESSNPPTPPTDGIPLRTRLQLILPLSEDEVSVPCHGRVLRARLLHDSQPPGVEA